MLGLVDHPHPPDAEKANNPVPRMIDQFRWDRRFCRVRGGTGIKRSAVIAKPTEKRVIGHTPEGLAAAVAVRNMPFDLGLVRWQQSALDKSGEGCRGGVRGLVHKVVSWHATASGRHASPACRLPQANYSEMASAAGIFQKNAAQASRSPAS
jgi:hypothetical protein